MEPVQKLTTNQFKDSSVSLTLFFVSFGYDQSRGAEQAPGTAFSSCHLFVSSEPRERSRKICTLHSPLGCWLSKGSC